MSLNVMRLWSWAVGLAFFGLIGNAVVSAVQSAQEGPKARKRPKPKPAIPAPRKLFQVPLGQSPQRGPADALITIVEFSDFQCQYCKSAWPVIDQIFSHYRGQVRLVFKNQPLPHHIRASRAAEYAMAAHAQGKFWRMHDLLFANQSALEEADLLRHAESLGLDMKALQTYLKSGRGRRVIQADQALARQVGALSPPAFFINGVPLSGARPFSAFRRVIDQQLLRAQQLRARGVPADQLYSALVREGRVAKPQNRPASKGLRRRWVRLDPGTPTKGAQRPLVTMVAFLDFTCSYSARLLPTLEALLDAHPKDVQLRVRPLPHRFRRGALDAAKAALAAHRQGKYWPMHEAIFRQAPTAGGIQASRMPVHAQEIGLDVASFEADFRSTTLAAQLSKIRAEADRLGVRSTPTVFINGVPIKGAQPQAVFEAVLQEELERAKARASSGVRRIKIYEDIMASERGKPVRLPESR